MSDTHKSELPEQNGYTVGKNGRQADRLTSILRWALVFVQATASFFVAVCIIFLLTLCDVGFMVRQIDKVDYCRGLKTAIETEYQNLAATSQLPDDFFQDSVDYGSLYAHVVSAITAAYQGQSYDFSGDAIQTELLDKMEQYYAALDEVNGEPTEHAKNKRTQELKNLAEACTTQYDTMTKSRVLIPIGEYAAQYRMILWVILAVAGVMMLASIGVQFRLAEWKHRAVRMVMCGLLTTAVMLCVAPLFAYVTDIVSRIGITFLPLFDLVRNGVRDILQVLIMVSAVIFLFTVAVGFLVVKLLRDRVMR